ncbi:unnamed protein product [Amoebophrya sp. A120]|nr:unnamed protein product [Amoebophrya sp. A120]|eukprot:GSA120T00010182001.1
MAEEAPRDELDEFFDEAIPQPPTTSDAANIEEDIFGDIDGLAQQAAPVFDDNDEFGQRVKEYQAMGHQGEYLEGEEEQEAEKPKNAFEEALDRIAKSKKVARAGMKIKDKDSRKQASMLVQYMETYHENDIREIANGRPALHKARAMDNVKKLINRQGFKSYFVTERGVEVLNDWINPVRGEGYKDDDRAEPPMSVIEGVLYCLEQLGTHVEKEDIVDSGIGVTMRRIAKDRKYPNQVRSKAQALMMSWVQYVTGAPGKRARDDEDNNALQDEALEVDANGRRVAKTAQIMDGAAVNPELHNGTLPSSAQQLALVQSGNVDEFAGKRQKTERELNAIWAPSKEDELVHAERAKMRHAVMPMEKPVFSLQDLPVSNAPAKRKMREDPSSVTGKISQQLHKISNPNKKPWKSTVGQPSISGSGIVYKW